MTRFLRAGVGVDLTAEIRKTQGQRQRKQAHTKASRVFPHTLRLLLSIQRCKRGTVYLRVDLDEK